jgi:integrase
VAPRTVEVDLCFLRAVCNWAMVAGDGRGGTLLSRNPVKGLKMPREKNPRRVVLSDSEYQLLLGVADHVGPFVRPMLILANETGHRIGAIRQLLWSDIDFREGVIRWRAATEKTGFEHVTPMTSAAAEALRCLQSLSPGIGEAPVFPGVQNTSRSVSSEMVTTWWRRTETLAGLEPKPGRGWHSLRRKFASDLMHKPLKVVSLLGGWKSPQTILMCYQHPDQNQLREALEDRRRYGTGA